MAVSPRTQRAWTGQSLAFHFTNVIKPVLQSIQKRLAAWLALGAILQLATVAGAICLLAVLADAALDLPENLRASAPVLLGSCLLAVLVVTAWRLRRLTAPRIARLFETRHPNLGTQLTNAVQLAELADEPPGNPHLKDTSSHVRESVVVGSGQVIDRNAITRYLLGEAIELGRRTAATLPTWPVGRGPFLRAAGAVAVTSLAWVALVFLGPDLLQTVWPRFQDPHGDHPPFSTLRLDVQPQGGQVLYGGQFEVRATSAGRPVDKLWLVARSRTNESRTVMFLAPDRSFFQTLSNLREPAEYYVTDGRARTRRFPIRIRLTPQITLVEVTTVFPDYTALPSRTAKLADEPLALPEGTRVQFRVASNRPLQSGTLALAPLLGGPSTNVSLTPEPSGSVVTGAFTLAEPIAFTLGVQDVEGLASSDTRQGRFQIRPDERPRLFVLEPGRDAVATPSFSVPIHVQAADDFGVTRLVWLRGHNRSLDRPFSMKIALRKGPQDVEARGAFDLARLGVRAGDVIEYYFEAADNFPKGPNLTLSKLYRLEIISEAQYEHLLRQASARQALFEPYLKFNAWLRRTAEQARQARDKAQQGDPSAQEAAKELADQLEALHREMGQLMDLPQFFDIEEAFRAAWAVEHNQLAELKLKARQTAAGRPLSAESLKQLAQALEELVRQDDEQIGTPARHLASVAAVLARADDFVRLAREQATLARLLRRFADRTDALTRLEQLEVQELAHQERRIRERLRTLVDALPSLLAQVPTDAEYDALREDVNGFITAIGDARIDDDLAEAAQLLAKLDPATGYALAQSAAEKMDRLVARCQAQPEEGAQCLQARFKPRLSEMGQSLSQILSAMGKSGGGGSGEDGYSMFQNDVGVYGPNMQLAGEQAGPAGRGSGPNAPGTAPVASDAADPGLRPAQGPARIRLQPEARFPLRYRDLVGDYFRAIAESAEGKEAP